MIRKLFISISGLFWLGIFVAHAQAPVADFSASTTSGCGPLGVNFKDLSTNGPLFWTWDFGNGVTSSQQNPAVAYNAPGTYTVTLIVRNTSGSDAMRKTNYITVLPYPTPGFASNLTLACAPANIQFNDNSTPGQGSITAWNWNLGDGTTSNQQNPSHTYTQTGYYNVSLTVTNSGGCSNTAAVGRYLRVVPGIQPDFSFNQTSTSCSAPFVMNFINQTAGPGNLTYNWNLGNGAIPASSTDTSPTAITYPSGSYTVTLQVQSSLGCSASIQKPLSFAGDNAVINSPDIVCVNAPASFVNGSAPPPASSVWDFGDGTGANGSTASKAYTAAGPYTVKLVNKYTSCVDSVTKVIQVVNSLTPAFTASSPTISCKAPFTVQFTDQTAPAPVKWLWDFGDGSPTSNQQNPSHTYTATGNFDVRLTVTSSTGCDSTLTKTRFIQIVAPTVTINAGSLQGCINPKFISPVANINTIDGVQSYAWTATSATPATSTASNPSFSYAAQGSYPVSLTITTNGGCQATGTGTVLVGTPVAAPDFTIANTPTCGRDLVNFTALSTPADHWDWSFGDGTFSPLDNSPTVSHSYNDIGNFQVFLTTFNNGCPSPTFKFVTVTGAIVGFKYKPVCPNPFLIQFTDTSHIDPASTPVSWLWNFGDPANSTSTLQNPPPFAYLNTGTTPKTYTVTLTITAGSCVKTISVPITLGPTVVAFTSPVTACRNANFTLTSTSTNPSLIGSYSWQIGANPPTLPSASPTYTASFPANGTYPLSLTITDISGCTSTATNNITITGPVAKFTATGGCKNSPIPFTDQTIPYPGSPGPPAAPANPITTWSWDFGDGTNTYLTSPYTHPYTDTGFYTVKLTVTDNASCVDTYTSPVQITSPQAFFSGPDSFYCPKVPLPLRGDSSQGYGLTYNWNFGDGSGNSTLPDPTHSFPTSGQYYNIQLTVTDQVGCSNTLTRNRYIHIQQPVAAFAIADTSAICAPLQTMFTANGQFYDSLYWDFGDGSTSTLPTTSHFYNNYGTYTAKLFLQGPGGCLDSASRQVFVSDPSQARFSYGPPTKKCDSILVNFQIIPPVYTRFSLVFGDGAVDSSGNTTPSHLFRNPASYGPQLVMEDASGCIVGIGSGSGAITVLGAVPFFSVDKHAFCDSSTVNFTDYTITNDGIVSETYTFGDGSSATQGTPLFNTSHFYNQPGTLLATLKVMTVSNCAENYTDTIRVHQTPHPLIATTGLLCTGLIQFQGSLTAPNIDTVLWAWDFANGQSSKQQDPSVDYAPGTYTVSLQTAVPFGCSDKVSQPVTINPLPVIKGPAEVSTPVGFPVVIPFTYSSNVVSWTWTPTAYLDCPTCANPSANPTFATEYTVSVTDANSCTSIDSILVKTLCNGVNYFLPNTFSPNGDGVNDVFYPRGVSLYNIQSMTIFNRWGQIVFQRRNFPANSASDGWDGNFNGRPAPSDAYVYIVEVICNNAQVVALRGDVTLVR